MGQSEEAAAEAAGREGAAVHTGTRVLTVDGERGTVARVHADGAYDLQMDMSSLSPRQRVSRAEFTVDEE